MRLFFMRYAHREDGTPAPGYLIQTHSHTGLPVNILVDTGFPDSMVGKTNGWTIPREALVTAQLAQVSLTPADIDFLVCTHLDPDHAGNHNLFTSSELVIQRTMHEFAHANTHARTGGLNARWNHPGLRYHQIDGDLELAAGVRLLFTPGHCPGHQSLLVKLPVHGAFVLAIDAIRHTTELDPDTRAIGPFDMDEAAVRASTRKLVALARAENARIICGHDGPQWNALRLLPLFYD